MKADTRQPQNRFRRVSRRWFAIVCAVGLISLIGCKNNKGIGGLGSGVSRDKSDPLFASGQNLIPKQNVPIPDRATGNGRPDPLKTTPTSNSDDKTGYTVNPDRFKGTVVLSTKNTPAALAGRLNDGNELKIDDGNGGVELKPAGGTLEPPPQVEPLYDQLAKLGIKREDCSLVRENGKLVFRATVLTAPEGPRTEYSGAGDTAAEAMTKVLQQLK